MLEPIAKLNLVERQDVKYRQYLKLRASCSDPLKYLLDEKD
jgi:hypothetical protein